MYTRTYVFLKNEMGEGILSWWLLDIKRKLLL